MKLFDTIPDNFFSVLSSKNKEIYAMALLVLYRSLQSDEMSIKKDDYIRTLREKATDLVMNFDFSEVEDEDLGVNPNLPTRVAFIVRRLEETGWIEIEMRSDTFEEYIALPSYSIQMLTFLNDIVSESEVAYNSLVHSTYSELKLEDEERDEFMYATLIRVYENTKKLRVELVTLGHSIRIFQNKLGHLFTTNEVLHEHFDEYKVRISDRYYHPLKTFDSVTKFKRPILAILQKWLRDDEVRTKLIMQAMMWGHVKDQKEAEQDIINRITYIQDMYEQVNNMVAEIDQKHAEYTKSSATKIIYLNNSDKTIKGHLETIFKAYAKANVDGEGLRGILSRMQDSITLFDQGYINPDSITLPIVRKFRDETDPLPIIWNSEEAGDYTMQEFLDQTRNSFTDERIYAFMETAFQGENEVFIGDIPLPDFDAFILLILASLKKNDDNCFYIIEQNDGRVVSQGYVLPNFTFKRKENVNNV